MKTKAKYHGIGYQAMYTRFLLDVYKIHRPFGAVDCRILPCTYYPVGAEGNLYINRLKPLHPWSK